MAEGIRTAAFLRLWVGSAASGLATWALPFVLGIALLGNAIAATQLGIVLGARTVGFLLAVPVSGVLADRSARRKVVLGASIIAASGIPLIIAGLGHSVTDTALMVLGGAVAGIGQGACRPPYNPCLCQRRRQQELQALCAGVVDGRPVAARGDVAWLHPIARRLCRRHADERLRGGAHLPRGLSRPTGLGQLVAMLELVQRQRTAARPGRTLDHRRHCAEDHGAVPDRPGPRLCGRALGGRRGGGHAGGDLPRPVRRRRRAFRIGVRRRARCLEVS